MKIKKQLTKLKYLAYELNKNGQIPSYLFHIICHIDMNTSEREIRFLHEITENAMRVKGFYKNHKDLEHSVSVEIEEMYCKFKEVELNG